MEKLIYVIIGSTRPTRIGNVIANWFADQLTPLLGKNGIKVEVVDLAQVNLPMFNEPAEPKTGVYKYDYTKRWSAQIARASGYVIVVPEYNHSYSAVVKNAIDYLFNEWSGKPMAIISYGWGGGLRAMEHLRIVAGGVKATPVQNDIAVNLNADILDQGKLKSPQESLAPYKPQVEALASELATLLKIGNYIPDVTK